MKIHFISLLILGVVVTCVSAHAQTAITTVNPNLQHEDRLDFSNASPIFIGSDTSGKMKRTGVAVTLNSTSLIRIVKI